MCVRERERERHKNGVLVALGDLTFLQWCCGRFESSRMLCYVIGYATSDILKDHIIFIFTVQHSLRLLDPEHEGRLTLQDILLPLAVQPIVGFGLSNSILPFFPIYHQTLSIFSLPALEDLILLPLSIFSWVFPFVSFLPVFGWRSFWTSYPPPFSPGDLTGLSFAL